MIPASQFATDSVLEGYLSSGAMMGASGAISETAPTDPDDGTDSDDNGTEILIPFSPFFGAVVSPAVTLNPAAPGEPTSEPDATDACQGADPSPDNLSNTTVDFGFYQTCVSNLVWIDDQDGTYDDAAESGFAGINVQLYASNGITQINVGPDGILGNQDDNVGGVLTAADGSYQFCGLPEGDYIVKLIAPAGYTSSSGAPGSPTGPYEPAADPNNQVDDDDNGEVGTGFNTGFVVSKPITQDAGNEVSVDLTTGITEDSTVDFGLYEIYTVGNQVWFDTDNDGQLDALEQGVQNVEVRLYTANGDLPDTLVATTSTDNDGYYLFTWLDSGEYVVVIPGSNFATGGPLEGYSSSLATLNTTGGYEEAPAPDPDNDVDNDDNGALALAGAPPAAGMDSVVSLAISLGTDGADELLGELVTSLTDPALDEHSNYGVDFGFYQNCLGNLVCEDLDNDGEKDATEDGLAGLVVQLFAEDGMTEIGVGPDGILGTADDAPGGVVTGPAGEYTFCGLPDGNYVVRVDAPFGYASSTGVNGQPVGPYEPGTDPNDNQDDDDNGTEQIDAALPDTFAITGVDSLRAGAAGALGSNVIDNNLGTTSDPSVDIGLFPTFSLGNQVFYDADNDAAKSATEAGVAGVCVSLYAADPQGRPTGDTIATDVTDAGGFYRFDGLIPGDYIVALPDSNFAAGKPLDTYHSSGTTVDNTFSFSETTAPDPDDNAESDDNGTLLEDATSPFDGYVLSGPVSLEWSPGQEPLGEDPVDGAPEDTRDDQSNYTVDFGFYRVDVGNLVFDDTNNSGTVDNAEAAYPDGVNLRLSAADGTTEVPVGPDGIYGTADDTLGGITSGPAGEYLFGGLPEGEYVIKLTLPAGYVSSSGTNASPTGPYEPDTASADDNIDDDDNGTQADPQQPDVASLPVFLDPGDPGGNALNTVDETTGITTDSTVDFGIYEAHSLGNIVWYDTDNDALRTATDSGIDSVLMQLFEVDPVSGAETQIDMDSTQNGGYYCFSYLAPYYNYRVVIPGANFDAELEGYYSSSTTKDAAADFTEAPAPAADSDTDNDDNGTTDLATGNFFDGPVQSDIITLGDGEPMNEDTTIRPGKYDPALDENSNLTIDFGFYKAKLGNLVFDDMDNNGLFDGIDEPLDSAEVRLYAADGVTQIPVGADGIWGSADDNTDPILTDTTGIYRFCDLPEGDYIIKVTPPEDYISSTGTNGSPIGPYEEAPDPDDVQLDNDDNGTEEDPITHVIATDTISLDPGNEPAEDPTTGTADDPWIDFGLFIPKSVGNMVWEDDDQMETLTSTSNDGMYQAATEDVIEGVALSVYMDADSNGIADTALPISRDTTAAGGFYLFDYLVF